MYTLQEWISPGRFQQHDALIRAVAAEHHLDPMLVKAVVWRESRFDARKFGSAGERGLMQVSEMAAQEWAQENRVENFRVEELFDPKINLQAGTWYLRRAAQHWEKQEDPIPFALAEYNAGASRAQRWAGGDDAVIPARHFPGQYRFPRDARVRRFHHRALRVLQAARTDVASRLRGTSQHCHPDRTVTRDSRVAGSQQRFHRSWVPLRLVLVHSSAASSGARQPVGFPAKNERMDKATIAEVLEKIATLLELKDENPFKIRAYTNAARSIETFGGNLGDLQRRRNAGKNSGHRQGDRGENQGAGGNRLAALLRGPARRNFRRKFSSCSRFPAWARKRSRRCTNSCRSARSRSSRKPATAGRVAELPGFGKTTQEKLCQAIAERAKHAGSFQLGRDRGGSGNVAERSARSSRRAPCLHCRELSAAKRRSCAISISSSPPRRRRRSRRCLSQHPLVESVIAQGPTKSSVRLRSGIQCDLRVVSATEYPFRAQLFYRKQRAQHRGAKSRAATRLDLE